MFHRCFLRIGDDFLDNKNIFKGLTEEEAKSLQQKFGKNEIASNKKENFLIKILHILCEPMFLLLIIAAIIYFILGEPRDGAIMLIFVIGIISIDIIQEWKTDKTLNELKNLSQPHIKVIRNEKEEVIQSVNLVPGDIMIISEGIKIPADGSIVKCNDLCIDESSLTGESEGVWKTTIDNNIETNDYWKKDYCYAGTLVTQGSGYILVDKIGTETEYGKISKNIAKAPEEKTPLQIQTRKIVKISAIIAVVLFILVGIFTYFNIPDHNFKDRIIESILSGITLAMAMIPEEFPVILTVFLSMGAWRLAKKKSLVKKLPSVETLGSISVLCVDKTGTITKNKMTVNKIYSINNNEKELIKIMGMACEEEAYDPMEKAILKYCDENSIKKEDLFSGELIKEYAFTNELKMMGHIWRKNNKIIMAAKGAPESIFNICNIENEQKNIIQMQTEKMSQEGMRVIAVATRTFENEEEIPDLITNCNVNLIGLIGLIDPPKDEIKDDIEVCNKAGVRVVMITGDNGITAKAIAKQVGIKDYEKIITGEEIDKMTDEELKLAVEKCNLFSRVIPEHKMRIVKAFKENNQIVAMTGDGVNDAPALKYADIGIAMGKKGSEVSREAADLILLDDNFSTIVDTIRDGRRIYDNIRKAIGYVFTIHIPIAFASLLAPLLNISPSNLLLLPLHVVLLELIIDPTCSIVLERQPAEPNIMERKPRKSNEGILDIKTLIKSIIQGLIIFACSFGIYYFNLLKTGDEKVSRTMGLAIIILANFFLVQVNSSNIETAFKSLKRLIKDKVMWLVCILTIAMLIAIMYTPLSRFLKLQALTISNLIIVVLIAFISVFWYELFKKHGGKK
jgi:Ca2+-transporting ATPase